MSDLKNVNRRIRRDILNERVGGVVERIHECCSLAVSGLDFHNEWEAVQDRLTELLSELHRFRDLADNEN